MTASLLPNGKQQFLDSNGSPLSGGSVYFYIPNTTTPKDTWQDSGQTILNTNPVLLNAAGEALIYGNGVYRQVVKDVLGNTIWDELTEAISSTATGYYVADRTALANLTPGTGEIIFLTESGREGGFVWSASNHTSDIAADPQQGIFVPPASDPTGATGAWVRKIPGEYYNVQWFGALADGVTDSTTAIQACADLAISKAVGGIFFPSGSYIGHIALQDKTNFRIWCEGPKSATLTTPDTTKPPINIFSNVGSGSTNHFSVENLKLMNAGATALRVWNALHFSLKLVTCYGTLSIQGSGNFVVDNCEAYPTAGTSNALAIGSGAIEGASLTNAGPGVVLGGQYQSYGTGGVHAIYIQGDPLGISFIGTMYSGTPADYSVLLEGPAAGTPIGSVNFIQCHGESNYPASGEGLGADFYIGQTHKFGHVGIYGGNSWAYDAGSPGFHYHGYGILLGDARSVEIVGWTASKLAGTHGFDSGTIFKAAGYTGSYDIRDITNDAVGATYAGFSNISSTYTGDATNRKQLGVENITVSGTAVVSPTGTAVSYGVTFASAPVVTANVRGANAYVYMDTPGVSNATMYSSSGSQTIGWSATGIPVVT